jgi:hypothetical protein
MTHHRAQRRRERGRVWREDLTTPIRKHVVTDGITSEIATTITPPMDTAALVAEVQEHNREEARRSTFDGCVEALERLCRKDFDKWRAAQLPVKAWRAIKPFPPPIAITFGSREWYAQEILTVIEEVRHALACGEWQRAASEAVVVGALAAEAQAKHRWPMVQFGIKHRHEKQLSGRGRGKAITKKARADDEKMRRLVSRYRTSDEQEGHLVKYLAEQMEQHPKTIRLRLKRLGIPPV